MKAWLRYLLNWWRTAFPRPVKSSNQAGSPSLPWIDKRFTVERLPTSHVPHLAPLSAHLEGKVLCPSNQVLEGLAFVVKPQHTASQLAHSVRSSHFLVLPAACKEREVLEGGRCYAAGINARAIIFERRVADDEVKVCLSRRGLPCLVQVEGAGSVLTHEQRLLLIADNHVGVLKKPGQEKLPVGYVVLK